jgi:hypothetical protein
MRRVGRHEKHQSNNERNDCHGSENALLTVRHHDAF